MGNRMGIECLSSPISVKETRYQSFYACYDLLSPGKLVTQGSRDLRASHNQLKHNYVILEFGKLYLNIVCVGVPASAENY